MFTEKFVELLQKRSIKPYHIAKATGISPGLMSEYSNGIKLPTLTNLLKIADYLECSIDYLLERDNTCSSGYILQEQTEKSSPSDLTENEQELLYLFAKLTPEQQYRLIGRAEALAEQNDNEALNKESV